MKNLLFVFLLFFVLSCGNADKVGERGVFDLQYNQSITYLPINATNITDIGNGWIYFDLDGYRFLYKSYTSGYKGYTALTVVGKLSELND